MVGLTILRIHQLISVHLFVGLALIGPVALKMGSTGYRFVRYYARNPDYREKGPPEVNLRLIAPVVVATLPAPWVAFSGLCLGGLRRGLLSGRIRPTATRGSRSP